MRGVSVASLLFAYVALVRGDKCGPPGSVPYAPNATASDNCYAIQIANNTIAPDGVPRQAITVDGKMPGTLLTAKKGEDLYVQVANNINNDNLLYPTSVHWHGIRQPRTAYDDGPAFVTQCPLIPNTNYTYKVETTDQTGTYWYHSHYHSQYVDGLRGPLVIYDDAEKAQYNYTEDDENTIITITDWYHHTSVDIINNELSQSGDSGLLNGLALYRDPNNTNAATTGQRAVINVQQGKRYRFRLINMSGRSSFWFGIEGHSLTVIEADGINHQPLEVSSLWISAGQRYSVILDASQSPDNYWVAYPPRNFSSRNLHNGVGAFAVLHYDGAAPANVTGPDPSFTPDESNFLQEYKLVPLAPLDRPANTMSLAFSFDFVSGKWYLTSENGTSNFTYTSPAVPTLLEILASGGNNQTAVLPPDVIVLPNNTSVEVTLAGGLEGEGHPFHLHGHHFEIVQSGNGSRNDVNPPIRDTIDTNNGWFDNRLGTPAITIRFPTNNPGPWFLHCHIDWHLEEGLALVFAEDPELQREEIHPPKEWCDVCRSYDSFSGTNASTALCNQINL